jgi:hypothetical protein
MSITATQPPGRRRPELLVHLPALRANLQEQRVLHRRRLIELLEHEDLWSAPRPGWARLIGDEATTRRIDTERRALRSVPQTEACEDCRDRTRPRAGHPVHSQGSGEYGS